jgi:MoxR-like ATPase
MEALKKIQKLEKELNGILVERKDEIRAMLVALVSGSHILLLGPPGTAKSMLASLVCKSIDKADYFEILMMKTTVPEELFGPFSMKKMKEDMYCRVTANKLPEAHVALVDEIFKGNSTVQNSMLTILNEREFDNGVGRVKVPLITCVGASNELPQGEELGALYDRFLIRFWVRPIQDDDAWCDLLEGKTGQGEPTTKLTLNDLKSLKEGACKIEIDREMTETLRVIFHELVRKGIQGSDRRWKAAVKIMKTHALLSGSDKITDDELETLTDMMWDNPEDRRKVQNVVLPKSNPLNQKAIKYEDQAKEIYQNWLSIPDESDEKSSKTLEANGMLLDILKQIKTDVHGLADDRTKKLREAKTTIQNYRREVVTSLRIDDDE